MKVDEILSSGAVFRHKSFDDPSTWNICVDCVAVRPGSYRIDYLTPEGEYSWFYCDKGSHMEIFAEVIFEVIK